MFLHPVITARKSSVDYKGLSTPLFTPVPLVSSPYLLSTCRDQPEMLSGIDTLWRSNTLFRKEINLSEYIVDLLKVVEIDSDNYLKLLGDSKTDFKQQFSSLFKHPDLSLLQKAFCLIQALELALVGVDATPVLKKINQSRIIPSGSLNFGDNTRGYRGELLASWFLAKFIYKLDAISGEQFKHSVVFSSSDNNKQVPRSTGEVDLVIHDALASVKFKSRYKNYFVAQVCDLFFRVIGHRLQDRIKKLILVRKANNSYEFSPDYIETREYESLNKQIKIEAERVIFQQYKCENHYRDYFRNLDVKVYFVPDLEDTDKLREWIELNYDWSDQVNSYYLYDLAKGSLKRKI